MTETRGLFICFEGIDRSGKSTACQQLATSGLLLSKGLDPVLFSFPERSGESGQKIDQYLKNKADYGLKEQHLLFSVNRWEFAKTIKNRLLQGHPVLVDRYAYSGVAYSRAKGMDLEEAMQPDKGLPKPDLVIQLVLNPLEASMRGDYGQERHDNPEFQSRVARAFDEIRDPTWVQIDASRPQSEVFQEIKQVIEKALAKPRGPLAYLW